MSGMFFRPHERKKHVTCQKCRHLGSALRANMGQKWCQLSLPSDSVRRLTLRPGVRRSPVGQSLAGLAIDRLFSAADASVKGIRRLGATTSFACVHEKMGPIVRLQQRSLTNFIFARMERLASAIYDMKWCSAITATALNSVRPVLHLLGV